MKSIEPLISHERLRHSKKSNRGIEAETQSDRARVIYSASFRRLQQKAQVFSLESNSSVRSRLTHSLEVSHIGRYIVAMVHKEIKNSQHILGAEKKYWDENVLAISNIVETACLMHDIGNPPFGHFGEAAIQDWTESSSDLHSALEKALTEEKCAVEAFINLDDFKNFDGNPQGFRNISKTQGDDGWHGLNLTVTQLLSFLKYSSCPHDQKEKSNKFNKKIGYFSSESEVARKAREKLKMPAFSRHPLSFIMEASDDISYCISDIEDGIEKKVIRLSDFIVFLENKNNLLKKSSPKHKLLQEKIAQLTNTADSPISNFLSFKTDLQNDLVSQVAAQFLEKYFDILKFEHHESLLKNIAPEQNYVLELLREFAKEKLFTSEDAESMEISGYAVLSGILKVFNSLIKLEKNLFFLFLAKDQKEMRNNGLLLQSHLFNKLPDRHVRSYIAGVMQKQVSANCGPGKLPEGFQEQFEQLEKVKEMQLRLHLIVDFIAGMTDQYSLDFYQMTQGIKVG